MLCFWVWPGFTLKNGVDFLEVNEFEIQMQGTFLLREIVCTICILIPSKYLSYKHHFYITLMTVGI